jgi:hypothetical protein
LYPQPFPSVKLAGLQKLTRYLRPVNLFLTLKDGRVVLVSEYEADKLAPVPQHFHKSKQATLQHLCMVVDPGKNGEALGGMFGYKCSRFAQIVLR